MGGGLSILIKVLSAVLAYTMLLAIARATTAEQYGIFAVAFSVAMSASLCALLGQHWAITRFWPQWMGQDEGLKARSILRLSIVVVGLGLGAAAAIMLLGGALNLVTEAPWTFAVAAGTALFMFAFGWAEFASAGLRVQGYIVIALAPRDVVWRAAVCVMFAAAATAGWSFRAEWIIVTIGALLLLFVAPQIGMLYRASAGATMQLLPAADRTAISKYSIVMWAATTVELARTYAGVVIVSAFLGVEDAGAYFAADRTANILSFILLAINLVSAPLISRYYHSGRIEFVRLVVGLSGLGAGLAALTGLVLFFFFGADILAFFKPSYGSYLPVLLILACGQFIVAAAGPVGNLLVLTGHERVDFFLIVSVGLITVAGQVVGGLYWGPVGVAVGSAGGAAIIKLLAVAYAWRTLDIDSTGLTLAGQTARKLLFAITQHFGAKS